VAWDDIRQDARLAVHSEFGRAADYLAPGETVPVACTVRFHTRVVRQGDLDREGYAEVYEDVNRIVFLRSEVTPVRRAVVTLDAKEYTIDTVEPSDDGLLAVCNVVPKALTL
jgi:hypothetical protein